MASHNPSSEKSNCFDPFCSSGVTSKQNGSGHINAVSTVFVSFLCLIFFTLRLNLHNILLYHVTDTLVTALKRPRLVEFQSQQFRSVYHIYHPVSLLYCERIYLYDLLGRLVLKIQICYTLRCAVT